MDAKDLEQRSLEELLELYLARFGQQFQTMLCLTMSNEKVKEIIIGCIVFGHPWEPRLFEEADY